MNDVKHEPVLLDRVIEFLRIGGIEKPKKKVVDCTLGLGGYSERILRTFPEAWVYGLDRDPHAVAFSVNRLLEHRHRFEVLHTNFGVMKETLRGAAPFDAFIFDLGVSNMQLTEAERGFSFQQDGPLDMRMNPEAEDDATAADVLESLSAAELAKVFWTYGEERHARRIATKIEERRKKGNVPKTTAELVSLIREVLPAPVQRKMGTHPARRVFQALRICVNDELKELERGLSAVESLSSPEAMVIVVSYHSLEDRIVKHKFRAWEKEEKKGVVLTKHPVLPDEEELEKNFKARSAKLRVFCFQPLGKK
ncbi:MAG: 16S rRNA (cytosine(1402)-N(4))-methyltransferase RsmH [Synergistaceae bacterium]|nr:16S rRNA (cytosine(1402)-N(4))-methyltransferase RsmH [Synergistaceae bacterium]